ncbi:hypothetical protein [Paenibacillus taichungensis]|uniref:hypothetical protein n=1 Tax=Paenibacillus taichungensis TaxID=484184 RepID=UPI0039A366A5
MDSNNSIFSSAHDRPSNMPHDSEKRRLGKKCSPGLSGIDQNGAEIEYSSIAEMQTEDYDSHITYSRWHLQDLM